MEGFKHCNCKEIVFGIMRYGEQDSFSDINCDYIIRYNEEEDEAKLRPYNGVVIDEEPISDDEKTLETMENFETKYRFRYELHFFSNKKIIKITLMLCFKLYSFKSYSERNKN